MPVWSVINHQLLGFSDEEILYNFPSLTAHDLENARAYYDANKAEIDNDIRDNYLDEEAVRVSLTAPVWNRKPYD